MMRSTRLTLLLGVFFLAVAFVGIAILLTGNQAPSGQIYALPDGRQVMCVKDYGSGSISCDWDHAK